MNITRRFGCPFFWISKKEIENERKYQDNKWGYQLDDTVDAFHIMMIKTASLCIAAIESIDRQRANSGKTFYE